jgi:hypothetical protein
MINIKNDEIIKSVIREDFSNITGEQIDTVCSKISNGNKQDSCYDQLDGTRPNGKSESLNLRYWKAVSKGYEGTIEEYEQRESFWTSAIDMGSKAGSFLGGLFNQTKPSESNSDTDTTTPEKEPMSLGVKIGIGAGVLALIGGVIYFIKKRG